METFIQKYINKAKTPPAHHPVWLKVWHEMPCPFVNLFCSNGVLALFAQEDAALFAEQCVDVVLALKKAIDEKRLVKSPGSFVVSMAQANGCAKDIRIDAHISGTWQMRTCLVLVAPGENTESD